MSRLEQVEERARLAASFPGRWVDGAFEDEDVRSLLARVRELESALTFYTNPDLYEEWTEDGVGQIVTCPPPIMVDRGEHAMAALAGESTPENGPSVR